MTVLAGHRARTEALISTLTLLVCSGVFFARSVFGDGALFARDIFVYYFPLREFIAHALAAGHIPGWDPSTQSGLPIWGDLHAGLLYPLNLVFTALSFPRAYGLLIWAHDVWLGLGTYALLRRLGADFRGALAGALTFALCGYVIGLATEGPLLKGASFLPWALFLVSGAPSLRRVAWLALVISLEGLTGDPQAVLLTALSVLALWAVLPDRRRRAALVAGAFALAGLVDAVQLLPAWELLHQSNRTQPYAGYFEAFAFHPGRLLELFLMLPFGRVDEAPHFWAHRLVRGPGALPLALSAYVGAAGLAAAALGARRGLRTRFGLVLIAGGLLLAFGPYGPLGWLLHLPPFRFFRYPEKYLLLVALGAAVLIAEGVTGLIERPPSSRRLVGVGAVGVLLALFAAAVPLLFGPSADQGPTATLPPALLRASVLVLLTVALAWTVRREPRWAWLLLPLVAVDLMSASSPIVLYAPLELYEKRPEVVDVLLSQAPQHPFRYLRDASLEKDGPSVFEDQGQLKRHVWDLLTLKSDLGEVFGLEDSAGYGGFSLGRWETLAIGLYDRPAVRAGVLQECFVLASVRKGRFDAEPRFHRLGEFPELHLAIFGFNGCPPRLRTITRALPVSDVEQAVRVLRQPEIDPTTDATLETNGSTTGTFAPAELSNQTFAPERISADVIAKAPGALVLLATAYYPGWTARVDGRPVPLRILDGALMGVEVPEGRHQLTFQFEARVLPGIVASAIGLALVLLLLFRRTGSPTQRTP